MKKYLLITVFSLSCATISAAGDYPPILKGLDPKTRELAQEGFNIMKDRTFASKAKRWRLAIGYAKTGVITPEFFEVVNFNLDRDGTWKDKIRIKLWYNVRDYVWGTLRIAVTILAIAIGWPALLKGYRYFRPRQLGFTAELGSDKQVVYIGDTVNLTLSFSVPNEDKRYKIEPAQVDDKATLEQIGSDEYLKGKGEVRYKYTPFGKDITLPKFTLRDTKGRKGIGFTLPHIGDIWYIEPAGGYLTFSPTLAIKEVNWKLEHDTNASSDTQAVIKVVPEDERASEEDRKYLRRQKYRVVVTKAQGLIGSRNLKTTQNNDVIIVNNFDALKLPLVIRNKENPSLTLEVSYFGNNHTITIPLVGLYAKKLSSPATQNISPATYLNRIEVEQYKVSKKNKYPLIHAVKKGYLPVVQYLVEKEQVDINSPFSRAYTITNYNPLHWAAKENKIAIAMYLVGKGADVKLKTSRLFFERNSRAIAEIHGHKLLADYFKSVEEGHKLTPNNQVKNELYKAILANKIDEVKMYLKTYKNLNAPYTNGRTPLHAAAIRNRVEIAKLLLDEKANVNAQAEAKITPLHLAAMGNNVEMANLLIDAGAKKNAKDKFGRTPLHYAAMENKIAIAKVLIAAEADIEAQDNAQKTPLHWAAEKNRVEVVKLLIAEKANKEAQDWLGKTPLFYVDRSNDELVDLLT